MNKKYKLTRVNDSLTILEKFQTAVNKIQVERPELYDRVEDIIKDYGKFLDDTVSEDELQIILRAHLYIEQELTQLLKIYLKEPDVFLKGRIMFANKLSLTVALGLIPKIVKPAYDKLNQIRNGYAHNLDYKITDQDIDEIIQHFHGNLFLEKLLSIKEEITIRDVLAMMWINLRSEVKRLPLTLAIKENNIKLAENQLKIIELSKIKQNSVLNNR